ncbi:NADH-quinone oxidoreductase subunit NuoG [Buchnera aphidicola]|uniref:NADH-quinone oxidoreductase n=1 Tax=Buchnera aphidicola (Therioaphis trifolii) TaxID=1241884 RepID=A0A4D6YCW9_9GAMM|nr:NADH-quinone oxidoreductase subunit NuoG [Buchnera aphidicola]QCI27119.1 NADH-quinone oxidoreductase subunit NuoG [Buchnera aphidicola (Therioaphis trifolii)]
MVNIYINKKKYNVCKSENLLKICLSLNMNIPYFCWHSDLGSAGICRLCAVKQHNNLNESSGRIIMSCITPIVKNMIISTDDSEIKKFRKGIIELLMTNHPHDCPVCEEGGNCHLQDMTVLTGHNLRRYKYSKRVHYNQYLGDFISHQMNRCIGCYRCVRYYQEYAGGTDFGVYGISNNIYFGRFEDGDLESEHSGNLIEICPTGVFTDKLSSENYNRKWDLQYAPSICQHCNIGCNIIVGEKYGLISKIENRYHKNINRYFLCDLGRFGYTYLNNNRLKQPIQFDKKKKIFLNKNNAIKLLSKILKKNRTIGIGSIRSSLENNFSLRKLVGEKNFSSGMLENDHNCIKLIINILENSGIYIPTLFEVENYDVVLIIGEDVTQTSPRLDLAIRQLNKKQRRDINQVHNIPEWNSSAMLSISNNKNFVYIIHTHETKLDDISSLNYYASIKDQEIFSSILSDKINNVSNTIKNIKPDILKKISIIYNVLLSCKRPLIISGVHSGSMNLIKSTTNIAMGLKFLKKDVGLMLLTSSVNSIGVGILSNLSLTKVFNKINDNQVDTLIILENDLYRHDIKNKIDFIINKLKNIIVFDHQYTLTTNKANILFPIANFSESSGTVINYESRAQRFFSVFNTSIYDSNSCILEGWKWMYKVYNKLHKINHNITLDNVIQDYIKIFPIFNVINNVAPNSKYRIMGKKIARSPHRLSSRTAIFSELNIHEPKQKYDNNTMFTFSMEGIQQPNQDIEYLPFTWFPGWNSIQSWNKYIMNNDHYDSGVRIFNSYHLKTKYFFKNDINYSNKLSNYWKIIPYYCLFGSEELSQKSEIIKKKCFITYALINIKYKKILGLKNNSTIEFKCLGEFFKLSVKFSVKIPLKQLGLPIGFPNVPRILLGCTVKNIRGVI